MTRNVESAFTKFFREKTGFPKFKSKKNPIQSFPIPQHYTVDFENNTVKLPKIGEVKAVLTESLKVTKNSYSFKVLYREILHQYSCGRWKRISRKQVFSESTTIGIDVGIKDFAVLSNGEKIENPKYLKTSLKRLKVLQKRVSNKVKGSKNRGKP